MTRPTDLVPGGFSVQHVAGEESLLPSSAPAPRVPHQAAGDEAEETDEAPEAEAGEEAEIEDGAEDAVLDDEITDEDIEAAVDELIDDEEDEN